MVVDLMKSEKLKFFCKVFAATVERKLDWQETADPKVFLCTLDDEYVVVLVEVDDFEGANPDQPDQQLFLKKAQKILLTIDRRDIRGDAMRVLKDKVPVLDATTPYGVFVSLWQQVELQATHIADELDVANLALDRKLGRSP